VTFYFSGLPIGKYTVTALRDGKTLARIEDVELAVGQTRSLAIAIAERKSSEEEDLLTGAPGAAGKAAIDQEEAVTSELHMDNAAVDKASAEIGTVVEPHEVRNILLNGRAWSGLVVLAPLAINSGDGTQLSIRFAGRGVNDNNWTLDGVDASGVAAQPVSRVDIALAGQPQPVGARLVTSVESIAEFHVNSFQYTAQSGGGASGAQIDIVSQSGSNGLRGSVFEYLRNSAFDARNPFDGPQVPPFRLNQFGASAGGALKRNQTFFFASFEGLEQRLSTQLTALVPSEELRAQSALSNPEMIPIMNLYPVGQHPTDSPDVAQYLTVGRDSWSEQSGMARLDHSLSDKTSFFARYSADSGSISQPMNALNSMLAGDLRPSNAVMQLLYLVSSHVTNDMRLGFNRAPLTHTQQGPAPERFVVEGLTELTDSEFSRQAGTSVSFLDTLSITRGRHSLKAGGEFRDIRLNYGTSASLKSSYGEGPEALALNEPDWIWIHPTLPMQGIRRFYLFGFVMDEIRLAPALTLNLGVRYEYYSVENEVDGRGLVSDPLRCPGSLEPPIPGGYCPPGTSWYSPDRDNFDPRAALAWAPRFLGGGVLRAGYGIYHGTANNTFLATAVQNDSAEVVVNAPCPTYPILPAVNLPGAFQTPYALASDWRDLYSQQWSVSLAKTATPETARGRGLRRLQCAPSAHGGPDRRDPFHVRGTAEPRQQQLPGDGVVAAAVLGQRLDDAC
jgi:hypothetical protein